MTLVAETKKILLGHLQNTTLKPGHYYTIVVLIRCLGEISRFFTKIQ